VSCCRRPNRMVRVRGMRRHPRPMNKAMPWCAGGDFQDRIFSRGAVMLFLVVSTPRPERPSELAQTRQAYWPSIAKYQPCGVCRHIYARAGRGAVAVFEVEDNDALHRILNEWADIIPVHFDTYPLIDAEAANRLLAAQVAAKA